MKPDPPSRQSTIEAILDASARRTLPLRDSFVQVRGDAGTSPGALHQLARRGRDSTIEQYLLAHAWASGGDYDLTKHSRIWQRALGLPDDAAGRRTVLRNWKALAEMNLITAKRSGRWIRVTLLTEDGSGRPYRHPGEKGAREDYFQLPYTYWLDRFHEKLKVPGKTVLLIALTLGDWFWLPPRRAGAWYGVSPSTIERGLRELRRADVLEARSHYKEAPLAPEGYTRENFYRLRPPFGPKGQLAKGAPPEFTSQLAEPSPSRQAGRPRQRSKRRLPAAETTKTGKAEPVMPGG